MTTNPLSPLTTLTTLILLASLAACQEGGFAGRSGKGAREPATQTDPTPATAGQDDGGLDAGDGGGGGIDDVPAGGADAKPDPDGPAGGSDCLPVRADAYRFAIVLDTSASMRFRDPTQVRDSGPRRFVERFQRLVAESGKDAAFVVLAFNHTATVGSHGWVRLAADRDRSGDVLADIGALTASTAVGTHFDAALAATARELTAGKPAPGKGVRTYVIFFSDGRPTSGRLTAVSATQSIVTDHDAAFITISTGARSSLLGGSLMREMALPVSAGIHIEAESAEQVDAAWDRILGALSEC